MGETWTLIEHEQSGLVMVPLHQAERELAALRAQLTEKDREIEALMGEKIKVGNLSYIKLADLVSLTAGTRTQDTQP